MAQRVPLATHVPPWLSRLPATVDGGLWRQSGVDSEVMQQSIRFKLQQVSPITFLCLPKRPFKESNISEIEHHCAWGYSLSKRSFGNRRLGGCSVGNGGEK